MFSNSPKIRQGIYIIAVAAQVASFFVAIVNAELAAAFLSASGVLAAVAGVTALTNIKQPVEYIPTVDVYNEGRWHSSLVGRRVNGGEQVGGYQVPTDPMDELNCESCQ